MSFKSRYSFLALPFKITKDKALKIIEQSNKSQNESTLTESFVPFYSADVVGVTSVFNAKYSVETKEEYSEWICVNKTPILMPAIRTITTWHENKMILEPKDYPFGVCPQIYGDFKYPRNLIESVSKTNVIEKDCSSGRMTSYDQRKHVEPHEMIAEMAKTKILENLHKYETKRAEFLVSQMFNAKDVKIDNLKIDVKHIELKQYHIPIYTHTTMHKKHGNFEAFKFVNGYNGYFKGERMYSLGKPLLVCGVIGTGSFLFCSLHHTVIIGTSCALLGMFATMYRNHQTIKRNNIRSDENERDIKLNTQMKLKSKNEEQSNIKQSHSTNYDEYD